MGSSKVGKRGLTVHLWEISSWRSRQPLFKHANVRDLQATQNILILIHLKKMLLKMKNAEKALRNFSVGRYVRLRKNP